MKVTVDTVVFTYQEGELKVLLIKRALEPFKNNWSLPGGYINDNESADNAAKRKLLEETKLSISYLEQLYTFTDINRDPRGRTVSIAYYSLVAPKELSKSPNFHATEIKFVYINRALSLDLAFDHGKILEYGLARLRNKIKYEPIGLGLLPVKFTMSQLHSMYETLLDRDIDIRNFTRKFKKIGILDESGIIYSGIGRPAISYSFNKRKYNKLKEFSFENL